MAAAGKKSFDAFMAEVDKWIAKKAAGLVSSDLADWDYLSAWEDGAKPASAAKAALVAEGWEG